MYFLCYPLFHNHKKLFSFVVTVQMDHIELIKALIVFGADVEIHNDLGETPGLIAARTSKGNERERVRWGVKSETFKHIKNIEV